MENVKTEVNGKDKRSPESPHWDRKRMGAEDDEKDIRFCHLTDPSQADLKAAYEASII